jgi:hypothetical protein
MRASKYPLESCGSPLPFWYLTLSQISDQTAPDFNLLTTSHSQDQINVVIRFLLFGGDAVGLSIAICYGASKHYAPTCNLLATIESSLGWFLVVITLPSKILNQMAFLADFFFLRPPNENGQHRLTKHHH